MHADLAPVSTKPWNDIVVDARSDAYVNSISFDLPREPAAPGVIALARPDGQVTVVAEDLAFPNGMALSDDGATLLVAESYAEQITAYDVAADATLSRRRVWAPTPGEHPDGICLDATGALWCADVAHRSGVRVLESGAVLDSVELDRGAFACALNSGTEPMLLITAPQWGGPGAAPRASGQVLAFPAPAPGNSLDAPRPRTYRRRVLS